MARRGQRSLFLIPAIASLVFGSSWYLVKKPQRDAERFLTVLRNVQVGQTSTEDLNKLVQTEGPAGVRLWCSPDLERLAHHFPVVGFPLPPSSDKPYEIIFPALESYGCRYEFTVTNALLRRLRLAPLSGVTFSITTNSKMATAKGFHSEISLGNMTENDPFGYFAYIDVGEGREKMRLSADRFCDQPICVQRINVTPPGCPDGVRIGISSSAPLSERNRFLALNTTCFARLGGCKNAWDLLPVPEVR